MTHERLLRPKELAEALRRDISYVYAMRRRGFRLPGGTATLTEAREWLLLHPHPRANPRKTGAKQ